MIIVANASIRFTQCYRDYPNPTFSCAGVPTDENEAFKVTATLVQ